MNEVPPLFLLYIIVVGIFFIILPYIIIGGIIAFICFKAYKILKLYIKDLKQYKKSCVKVNCFDFEKL